MTATSEAPDAPPIEDYRDLLDRVFDDRVTAWTAEAEETERFPRKLIEYLGESGVFAGKWPPGQQHPDVAKVIELARKLGGLGSAGIGVGVGLHDSAIAILRRFGKSDYLKEIAEQAIRGETVLCIGASEQSGGSDLQIVGTEVRSVRDGFAVKGIKKFVSLSPIADHVMCVARSVDHDPDSKHGSVVVIAVPLAQCEIQTPYRKVGAGPSTPPPCTSTPGCPQTLWSRARASGWPPSPGGWLRSGCRWQAWCRRRRSGPSESPRRA
ncbi:acyl-CoA dehydrogenase fadE14 [Mycolicibacterium novocastrense]|uniref:Acyl-[acyl-carrier-protein] dehydrogenase MbtN n=1 Tax=Mycolicibacterium novocastrense TaxID=59813 RepID=A0ABQ0KDG3_MYCNV|nr:acyl-CoA dehydrogenase fadE14 [Mycolicibacterium novocastrense]